MGRIRKLTAVGAAASALLLGLPAAALASVQAQSGRGTVTGAVQVVQYRGYRVRVPAGWPVYNLVADPSRCVLFNRHAVYLGQPGSAQRCPERAFGRTGALLKAALRGLPHLRYLLAVDGPDRDATIHRGARG